MWLAFVNDESATADVAAWIRAGGPGLAPLPPILELHRFTPPRRPRSRRAIRRWCAPRAGDLPQGRRAVTGRDSRSPGG